jgi:hypothetical protein
MKGKPMNSRMRILAGSFCLLIAGPAGAASCTDEIAALDSRLTDEGRTAISASTSGKGVAGAREGQAVVARDNDVPVTSVPQAPAPGTPEAQATQRAEEAGGGGDRVMQAKVTLNRARNLDQQGNANACLDAVAEAKRQLED